MIFCRDRAQNFNAKQFKKKRKRNNDVNISPSGNCAVICLPSPRGLSTSRQTFCDRPYETTRIHRHYMVPRGLRRALSWSPMIPGGSFSDSRLQKFKSLPGILANFPSIYSRAFFPEAFFPGNIAFYFHCYPMHIINWIFLCSVICKKYINWM